MTKNRFNYVLMVFILYSNVLVAKEYYNITDYGAVNDGKTINTFSIQSAIDKAAENGGGIIFFPAGNFLTRTIVLKDNVTLYLSNGCKLLATTDLNRFDSSFGSFVDSGGRKFGTALVFAKEANNISIIGDGIIDGQGYEIYYPHKKGFYRPYIIRFIRCNFVNIKDITLRNSAAWVQHYVECDDLLIDGIVSGSIPVGSLEVLAKIDGSDTKKIIFRGNYLDENSKKYITSPDVSANQVYESR
ncbi:hypothetical protein GF407_14850 [candidate division KSB1 bacterium]|nr:hypothetical protein [candidate division KSB1 bacterium]